MRQPALMEIRSIIPGSEGKKIWFAHFMLVDGAFCVIAEVMIAHYHVRKGRTVAMLKCMATTLVLLSFAISLEGLQADCQIQQNRQQNPQRNLIAIMIRFIRSIDRDIDIIRLLLGELGEFDPQFFEMQSSNFFVQMLG